MKAVQTGSVLTITVDLSDERLLSSGKCHQNLCMNCYRLGWISSTIVSFICRACELFQSKNEEASAIFEE